MNRSPVNKNMTEDEKEVLKFPCSHIIFCNFDYIRVI